MGGMNRNVILDILIEKGRFKRDENGTITNPKNGKTVAVNYITQKEKEAREAAEKAKQEANDKAWASGANTPEASEQALPSSVRDKEGELTRKRRGGVTGTILTDKLGQRGISTKDNKLGVM